MRDIKQLSEDVRVALYDDHNVKGSDKSFLIALCGVPGSGKSTVSELIAKKFSLVSISTDDIKAFLRKASYPFQVEDLFIIQYNLVHRFLQKGVSVIADGNCDKHEYQSQLRMIAKTYTSEMFFVVVETPIGISIERYIKRKEIKDRDTYTSLRKWIAETFDGLERPSDAVIIDNSGSLDHTIEEVDRKVKSVLSRCLHEEKT